MIDYKVLLRRRDVGYDHIDPTPRSDFQRVYVFTMKDIPTDKLRTGLEKILGGRPKISNHIAINSMLYVIQTSMPEGMPEEIRNALTEEKLSETNAVFIRGATNPFCKMDAQEAAGNLLLGALIKFEKTHEGRLCWRFREAMDLLDTHKVLNEYDKKLAAMEFARI